MPTPLPIERRSGCHGREILRRDVEPAINVALRTPTRRTKLLTAIECRGGGHVRDILRREVRPASTCET